MKRSCPRSIESNAESNPGLALFRQTQTLSRPKNLQKHDSEIFHTFDECLISFYKNNKKFPFIRRPLTNLFFEPQTKLSFSSIISKFSHPFHILSMINVL